MGAVAEDVHSLTSMLGSWTLCATTNGYFDIRPRVDFAQLNYEDAGRGRVKFLVRFQVRTKEYRLRGRARAEMGKKSGYNWWGSGAWLVASRAKWTLVQSTDGRIAIVRNGGSMMAEPGALVLARDGVPFAEVRTLLEAHFRAFGLTPAEYQTMRWRPVVADRTQPAAAI